MKILALHTKDSYFKVTTTPRVERLLRKRFGFELPAVEGPNREMKSGRALVFLVCAEKGDENLKPKRVVEEIKRSSELVGEKNVVLAAFAHLSVNPMGPKGAFEVIEGVVAELKVTANLNVTVVPFGHDKGYSITGMGHHYNVAFLSLSPLVEGPNN
ncbi:MAG: threonyl-tRNA synthetase editing domain-containing protein [Candidatus Micrarchaeota archaeon]